VREAVATSTMAVRELQPAVSGVIISTAIAAASADAPGLDSRPPFPRHPGSARGSAPDTRSLPPISRTTRLKLWQPADALIAGGEPSALADIKIFALHSDHRLSSR